MMLVAAVTMPKSMQPDGKWVKKEEERTTIEVWRRRQGDGGCWWRRWWLWLARMMETNDNPPKNVRVALTLTVVAVVANSG
jgi:hypothetical protein